MNHPTDSLRVFLADDHAMVRRGVRSYLEMIPDVEVVGEAGDGLSALQQIAAADPDLPDVVLMDLVMPEMDGLEATRRLKAQWPAIEVIAVTSFLEEAKIREALAAGASGYLLKDAEADDIAAAIRAAARGEVHLPPAVATQLAAGLRNPRTTVNELTPREKDVLKLIAAGNSNRQIATALFVTERTARTHVSNILTKLGLTSRTQAALWAVREGIAEPR